MEWIPELHYHALQVSVNRRVGDGLTLKGAYTWSKVIASAQDDGWQQLSFNYLPDLKRNRSLAVFDIPQNLQMAFVYELPFGSGKKYATSGLAKQIAGGWQVNGIFSAISGTPFSVTASGTALNAPNTQTADQVKPTVARLGNVGPGQYFYDPAAFAPVNQPRFGTSGLNILRIPNWINLDLSVLRKFPIRERFELELHGDAFNSLNTPHVDAPNGDVNSASFLQITSAEPDQRQLRIGLRLVW